MVKHEKLYNKKVIQSGDRLEIYNYNCYLKEGTEGHNKDGRCGSTGEGSDSIINKDLNRKKVLYRARNNIIRLISCNTDLQAFITLTYAEVPEELKETRKHLDIFFKKLKRKFQDLKYLWVMEFGTLNHRLHYHLLANVGVNIKTAMSNEIKPKGQKDLEQLWNKKYWKHGWVDIRNLKKEGNTNIAKYVACYLVEDMINVQLDGNRVYGYSKNLSKPTINKLDNRDALDDLISLEGYKLQFVNSYKIQYEDKLGNNRESQVQYLDYIKEV